MAARELKSSGGSKSKRINSSLYFPFGNTHRGRTDSRSFAETAAKLFVVENGQPSGKPTDCHSSRVTGVFTQVYMLTRTLYFVPVWSVNSHTPTSVRRFFNLGSHPVKKPCTFPSPRQAVCAPLFTVAAPLCTAPAA